MYSHHFPPPPLLLHFPLGIKLNLRKTHHKNPTLNIFSSVRINFKCSLRVDFVHLDVSPAVDVHVDQGTEPDQTLPHSHITLPGGQNEREGAWNFILISSSPFMQMLLMFSIHFFFFIIFLFLLQSVCVCVSHFQCKTLYPQQHDSNLKCHMGFGMFAPFTSSLLFNDMIYWTWQESIYLNKLWYF